MQDDTTNILLFLAQGFEDLEAIAVLDVFAWTRYREHIRKAAVTTTGFHEKFNSTQKPAINHITISHPGG